MPKKQFGQLLTILKSPQAKKNPKAFLRGPTPGAFFEFWKIIRPAAILIMESGIFLDGKLKGRKLPGGYRTYPINHLMSFVLNLAYSMVSVSMLQHVKNPSVQREQIGNSFNLLLEIYDSLAAPITYLKSARPERVVKVREELEAMRDKTMTKLDSTPTQLVEAFWTFENIDHPEGVRGYQFRDFIEPFIQVFKQHVPDAPDQTIATRISDLLNRWDFEVKPQTIRMRMVRKPIII